MLDNQTTAALARLCEKLEQIGGITPRADLVKDSSLPARLTRITESLTSGVLSAHPLGSHTDVALTAPVDGAFLRYDTGLGAWKDSTAALSEALTDVVISAPASAHFLQFNGTNWINGAITLGSLPPIALFDLSDATQSGLQSDKQVLRWRSSDSQWINQTLKINDTYFSDYSVVTGLVTGQTLRWNNTNTRFENSKIDVSDLNNTTIAGLLGGHVLKYNGVFWANAYVSITEIPEIDQSGGGGFQDQSLLVLDFASGPKWVPKLFHTMPLLGNWNAGDFDIAADKFTSALTQASTSHQNFVATNANTVTATDSATYDGLNIDFDYTCNNGAGLFIPTLRALKLTFDAVNTASLLALPGGSAIDATINYGTWSMVNPPVSISVSGTGANPTFGGVGGAGMLVRTTLAGVATFNGFRSEAIASLNTAGATTSVCGYFGYGVGNSTYTGNVVGVFGNTANVSAVNGSWGLLGYPAGIGAKPTVSKLISVGGFLGHMMNNGGSILAVNSTANQWSRPADITTTHLSFANTNGQLYVQGESEFDGKLWADGDFAHAGTNLGFYGAAAVARPAAYTQTYGTASRTHANPTAVTLTDSTGGTANGTVQSLTDPADTPLTADALRDDLVANLIPELRNNFADLAAQINALVADIANTKQVLNQVIDDLQLEGLLQ